MAKAIISSILESQLGKYVDGLSGDSLQVGLWSGELTLQDLSLKPHALVELNLPITVVRGSIRRIHVVVPWNHLGSASVQISIEGVYALVTPNTKLPSPEEVKQSKRNQIERLELVRQHDRLAKQHNSEGEDESTFLSRLTERIVDNLQITLRDVHFRYEDNISNPENPFACGVMIQSFTFHTTDAEGNEKFIDRSVKKERFLHKSVKIEQCGAYWDRLPRDDAKVLIQKQPNIEQAMSDMVRAMVEAKANDKTQSTRLWVLRPCSLGVKLTKNETTDFSVAAKFTIQAEMKDLSCALSREQYEDMLFLNRAFAGRRAIEAHFLHARARPFHNARVRPREWWDYALKLVLARKVHQDNPTGKKVSTMRKIRWTSVQRASMEGKLYVEAYRMQLRKGSALETASKERKRLLEFEMTYPVDVTMVLRNRAEDKEAEEAKAREETAAAAQSGGGSWYDYFFAPAAPASSTQTSSPTNQVLTDEGRANLKKAYDEAVEKEQNLAVPLDCNLFAVKILLKNGTMALHQSKHAKPFLLATFDGSLAVNVRPTNEWETKFRVQRFKILNGQAEGTAFHTFCSLGTDGDTKKSGGAPCASLDVSHSTLECMSGGEQIETAVLKVRLSMMPIRLMVDPFFVMFLQRFFMSMLPDQQLERVWSFATSSVSDWIFSEEDEDDLYRNTVGKRMRQRYDVVVDMKAPVVVIPEKVDDKDASLVVIDFGQFRFKNEDAPESSTSSEDRLYWSTQLSDINVRLGRIPNAGGSLNAVALQGLDRIVEEFSVKFALESGVGVSRGRRGDSQSAVVDSFTPGLCAEAVLHRVVLTLSQAQMAALGRIHSSVQAQVFGDAESDEVQVEERQEDSLISEAPTTITSERQTVKSSANESAATTAKDKFALKVSLAIGEVVVHLRETAKKDAFRIQLEQTAFELAVFSSRTIAQARLRSLVMEDRLYDASSRFFHLISTGEHSGEDENLVSLDVTMFSALPDMQAFNADREADTVIDLRCSVLDIQWNPSSIALLAQILSGYMSSLQVYAVNSQASLIPVVDTKKPSASVAALNDVSVGSTSSASPLLLRASLVQLRLTFNKDQIDRQLVSVAIQDTTVDCTTSVLPDSPGEWGYCVTGQLGNFIATDLSLEKHKLYDVLVGLEDTVAAARLGRKMSAARPLLAFSYEYDGNTSQMSTMKLDFEAIRVVYYHQQLMEFVDYLFEGILGALMAQTLATATQLLLTESEATVLFEVTAKAPSLLLPSRLDKPDHLKLTASALRLEHFPQSAVHYDGSGALSTRQRHSMHGEILSQAVVKTSDRLSLQADCKRITLNKVDVLCTVATSTKDENAAVRYESLLCAQTDLVVDVDDVVGAATYPFDADTRSSLPRFTIRCYMQELQVRLHRLHYLSLLSVIRDNFSAEQLLETTTQLDRLDSSSISLRPTMMYSYSRADIEAVTMRLIFEMNSVTCQLVQTPDVSSVDTVIDRVVQDEKSNSIAFIVGTKLSASLNQLQDQWPSVGVRLGAFAVQDRATSSLRYGQVDESQALTTPVPGQDNQPGVILSCHEALEVVYAWDETLHQCQIDMLAHTLHGIVVPECLMALLGFFEIPESTPPPSLSATPREDSAASFVEVSSPSVLLRRNSITSMMSPVETSVTQPYKTTVKVRATKLMVSFPQDVYDAESEQISMQSDVAIKLTWQPDRKELPEDTPQSSDLDIQSSLLVDATSIEVFVRNAQRQGCFTTGSDGARTIVRPVVQIIEPCQLQVEVNDLFPHAGQQQQIVSLKFSPIEVFTSYGDACIVGEVLESFNQSFARYEQRVSSAGRTLLDESDLFGVGTQGTPTKKRMSLMQKDLTSSDEGLEVHRYLTCDVGAMSLTLINDCDGCDMGLVQLQTQRCHFFLNLTYAAAQAVEASMTPATTISGSGSIVTLASYYNPDTRDWHPMCSEWSVEVSLQGALYNNTGASKGENELHVIVSANHSLDLMVTHGLLEVIASAGGAWSRRRNGEITDSPAPSPLHKIVDGAHVQEETEKRKQAPCVIRNDTGLPLVFWMTQSTEAMPTHLQQVVKSGSIADLHYTHSIGKGCGVARKYAYRERDGSMRLSIHLEETSFLPVEGIEFEQLGSRAFPLREENGSPSPYMLNCHARLVDGRIVLSISSQIKLVSKLAMPIQLLANDPTWQSPVEIGVLYPHRESAIPLMASMGTELRVRPLADAMYNWSAPIPVQTQSEVSLKVESTSSEAQSAIFCVSMTLEQSLRVVCFSEPIVLVNKLPVDIEFRVKSTVIGTGAQSRGGRISVGGKSGIWWSDAPQRPQIKLSVDGCQASRYLELVDSRTKHGQVFSIMLTRQDGRPFKLIVHVQEHSAKSLHILLNAEVWFINRTGLDIVYGNESEGEAYLPPSAARTLVGNAQISAYSNESTSSSPPVVRISMPSCGWSSRFTADPRRLSWQDECLMLRSDRRDGEGGNMLYEFGVSADYSTRHFGSITTLISVIPRYLIMNKTQYTVLLLEDNDGTRSQSGNAAHHILAKDDVYALYWVSGSRSKLRVSVIGENTEFGWSDHLSADQLKMTPLIVPAVGKSGETVRLQVSVKQGSISQSSILIVINEAVVEDSTTMASKAAQAAAVWDTFSIHSQLAGVIVTVADKKGPEGGLAVDLFGMGSHGVTELNENVARLTITRITMEMSSSRVETAAKMNVMGVKVEDLLTKSKNPVVLRPVARGDSFSGRGISKGDHFERSFLEISYLEKPHAKYRWIEHIRIDVQDVRVATTMRFVDRLNSLTQETISHFENHSYSSTSLEAESALVDPDVDEHILEYFVTSATEEDDVSMSSITGQKVYIETCEIAPVNVVVSFSREKGDVKNDQKVGFWLKNLKFKIENACLTLDAYKLSHALATQETIFEALGAFYVKSVKSQALGLIDSIQVTSLVTSAVTSGVTSLVSTIIGKTDPKLASSNDFRYHSLSNNQIIAKHSAMLNECGSMSEFMAQLKHLVYDWDSNHTGLEARGCIALGILNNSRHSLVINARLNDGAEIRVLPLGRNHLASANRDSTVSHRNSVGSSTEWRSDRAMIIFAWGYTPTLLTSGDIYLTVQSNACNVYLTRKTARLKPNIGYTTTFTHQEVQNWWATHAVIVGDDLYSHSGNTATESHNLFGDPTPTAATPAAAPTPAISRTPSAFASTDDDYEVEFTAASLGLIAKQSRQSVIVRECVALDSGEPGPALACGMIAPGDTILSVNGVTVTSTTQFRSLVSGTPRPIVMRFRRTGDRFNAAYDLFGEKKSAPPPPPPRSAPSRQQSAMDESYDLFGSRG
ncbi:hypothetical protein Poli38472_007181 [Pythium oligandrum]|uniref:PDZ domain-containing protein n=1 Tax=Pythium oligandrum TaxID=41045 RepID=A0A8K1C9V0_PYTOL|nr:hypothetical protein Poli38472_007181 [Pythium oligandrum]|eukprot:TMW59036.1 hypothetical protein Poli38472_007181 [Pythium oligandrum]